MTVVARVLAWWVKSGWVFIGLLTLLGAKYIDNQFFPVVTVFIVEAARVEPDAVYISGRLYKPEYRAGCEFDQMASVTDKGEYAELFRGGPRKDGTRPWGWSSFKNIKIPGEDISAYTLTARHKCYGDALWTHSKVLGVFSVQRP